MGLNNTFSSIWKIAKDSDYRFLSMTDHGLCNWMSDEKFIKRMFKIRTGYTPNLDNPKTFNEKLQWLKLHDRNPVYSTMADKYEARHYIETKIGNSSLIPLLGVWEDPEAIPFDELPEKFVLKCTHNSGTGMCICTDKARLDMEKVKLQLKKGLREKYYYHCREWAYKNIKPRIIAEHYLGNSLQDYRFYCFNGEPKLVYSYTNSSNDEGSKPEPSYCDVFNTQWEPVAITQKLGPKGNVQKPKHYEEMLKYARVLSEGIPFLRVDFYECEKLYVGELTFYPGSGMSVFHPSDWDQVLGSWIDLKEYTGEK